MKKKSTDGPVLHLLAPARQGGLERVVEMLADGQRARGVHVACVISPDEAVEHPFVLKMKQRDIPVTAVVVGRRSYRREYRELRALITQIRPRVLNTHGYRSDVIGILLARRLGIPVISTVHGFLGGRFRNRINETVQCFMLRRADAVIAVSTALVRRLAEVKLSPARIHLVQNGLSKSEQSITRDAARRRLGITDESKVVGWIGRLSSEKGPDVALEAVAQSGDSWHLSMIGDGPELGRLQQQIRDLGMTDRVRLHGEIPDAASLLPAFDAFMLSSRTEGTPIVLLEAMQAGTPIIATVVGGVPDVVSAEEALMVPPENPELLSKAIERLERDSLAAARRSAAARKKVREGFDLGAWVERVESVYAAAIKVWSRR